MSPLVRKIGIRIHRYDVDIECHWSAILLALMLLLCNGVKIVNLTGAMTQRLNALNNTKSEIKIDMARAQQTLKDAQKQFLSTGDAADEMAYKLANADYENARRNLDLVSKNARQAEKDILNMTDAVSRSENRVTGGGIGGGGSETSLAASLSGAGLGNMLGQSASNALNAGISSAFGSATGDAISSVISGAVSGAAMGSIAGPIGTAVGAAVGTAVGGINAAVGYFQKEDEAFKGIRNDLVDNALIQQAQDLAGGSGIASDREKMMVTLRQIFGEEEQAKQYWDDTLALANKTPFYASQLVGVGKLFKTFGYENDQLYTEMGRIADAGATLGWESSDMDQVTSVIGYMAQSGKVLLQQLKQLQFRGINAVGYMADAYTDKTGQEVSEQDIYKAISSGDLDGKEVAAIIMEFMGEQFSGGAEALSKTFFGLESTLGGLNEQMQNAMGEGYNEARMGALQEQINWLQGDSGTDLQEANRLIGEWRASLDNEKERILREHMENATKEIEEAGLTGAAAGEVLAQAQINAQAEYNASEGAQQLIAMQESLIEQTSKTLAEDPKTYDAGFRVGQAYSKGMKAGILETISDADSWFEGGLAGASSRAPDSALTRLLGGRGSSSNDSFGNAWGLSYVPYDGYKTTLHEGERVLTAEEARSEGQSGGMPTITGNNFYIREEADIYKVAQELASQLQHAKNLS